MMICKETSIEMTQALVDGLEAENSALRADLATCKEAYNLVYEARENLLDQVAAYGERAEKAEARVAFAERAAQTAL
jgi:hypothetical protein